MNWVIQSARDTAHVFSVIPRLKPLFFLFFLVNVVFGSLGITAPLLAASLLSSSSSIEFIRQLKGGGAYTFSLAFIASSCAFMVREYVENRQTSFRGIKAIAIMMAAGLAILLTLLSGINAASAFVAPGALAAQQPFPSWTFGESLQVSLLAVTVLYGVWLFCLEHIDRFPDEYLRLSDDARERLVAQTSGAVKAPDFEA